MNDPQINFNAKEKYPVSHPSYFVHSMELPNWMEWNTKSIRAIKNFVLFLAFSKVDNMFVW